MTADDFTEAARAEAEALFLNSTEVPSPQDIGEHIAEWARAHLAAQEPTDAELDALYDAFMAHSGDERSEEYTRTEDGEPYHERICSECGEAVWIKGEHYWAATRANGARKRHHVARAALSAARAARRDDTSTTPAHRILNLHAADADGNCTHCTRGRVYPVPAPCETVRALAGGGEGR